MHARSSYIFLLFFYDIGSFSDSYKNAQVQPVPKVISRRQKADRPIPIVYLSGIHQALREVHQLKDSQIFRNTHSNTP